MSAFLRFHEAVCRFLIRTLLAVVVAIDDHRRALPKGIRRWRGSLRRLVGRARGVTRRRATGPLERA